MSGPRVFEKDKDLAPIVDVRVWDLWVALASGRGNLREESK